MQIELHMVKEEFLPEDLSEYLQEGISRYLEYPTEKSQRRYVMQHHWRGRSVHKDFRMEMNDHLVGWSILDNPSGTPEVTTVAQAKKALNEFKDQWFSAERVAKGFRAETKCKNARITKVLLTNGELKSADEVLGRVFGSPTFDDTVYDALASWEETKYDPEKVKSIVDKYFPKDDRSYFEMFALKTASIGIALPHTKLDEAWYMDDAAKMIIKTHLEFYPKLKENNPYKNLEWGPKKEATPMPFSYFADEIEGVIVEGLSDICDEWKIKEIRQVSENEWVADYKSDEELESLTAIEVEELARQPKVWRTVEGEIKPGQVGATVEGPGVLHVADKGKFWEGSQKVYFHEYFVKSDVGVLFPKGKWIRIILRGVKVKKLDPETKKPIAGKFEILWRAMVPKDQKPYAISKRARSKNWYPPRNVIPVPQEVRTGEFKEEYDEWLEWVKGKWREKPKGAEKTSKAAPFVLHYHSWRGQLVVRGVPRREWYLRIDDKGTGKIRSFFLEEDPVHVMPVLAVSEGRVARKWLDFEGELKPGQEYNPTKKLKSKMAIEDKGTVEFDSEIKDGREIITAKFKGKLLKGTFHLVQEEKGSEFYEFAHEARLAAEAVFKVDRHSIPVEGTYKEHWDIRILKKGSNIIDEFNLDANPLEVKIEEPITAFRKKCRDLNWMDVGIDKEEKIRVGGLMTKVKTLDGGTLKIIDDSPSFVSMVLSGGTVQGYWIAKKLNRKWEFMRSRLPTPLALSEGHPADKAFTDFKVSSHKEYFEVAIFDKRAFTRSVADYKEYLPDLSLPAGVRDVLVGLYYRAGTLPGARVMAVQFDKEQWTEEKAVSWIKQKNLHTWQGVQIRKKRK